MKKAEIKDWPADSDEKTGLTAMSILIPIDWTLEGAPEYPTTADCSFTYGRIRFHASSPDGLTGIRVIPTTASVWSDNRSILQEIHGRNQMIGAVQQIKIEPPKSISQLLLETVRRLLPESRVEKSPEPMPELTGQLKPQLSQINRRLAKQATAAGMPAPRISAKAARVRVSWGRNEKRIEAWVVALQTVRTERLQTGGNFVTNDVPFLAVLYAPAGKLDETEGMLIAMLGSVQLHPEWQAETAQANLRRIQEILNTEAHLTKSHTGITQDNLRTQQKIAALEADVQQYRSGMISPIKARCAALESNAQQFSLHIGDQATYRDSATGKRVQLTGQTGHLWGGGAKNPDEYILTDSLSFNPNGRVGDGKWTKMSVEL